MNCSISLSVALMSPVSASRGSNIESEDLGYSDVHLRFAELTDLLQLFVFIPPGLGLVLLVPLFLLSVVSVHHFLIGRLRGKMNGLS